MEIIVIPRIQHDPFDEENLWERDCNYIKKLHNKILYEVDNGKIAKWNMKNGFYHILTRDFFSDFEYRVSMFDKHGAFGHMCCNRENGYTIYDELPDSLYESYVVEIYEEGKLC